MSNTKNTEIRNTAIHLAYQIEADVSSRKSVPTITAKKVVKSAKKIEEYINGK